MKELRLLHEAQKHLATDFRKICSVFIKGNALMMSSEIDCQYERLQSLSHAIRVFWRALQKCGGRGQARPDRLLGESK